MRMRIIARSAERYVGVSIGAIALAGAVGCGVGGLDDDGAGTGGDTDDGGTVVEIPEAPSLAPCAERDCGAHGRCIVIADAAVCTCEEGFLADESTGGACVACPDAGDGRFEHDLQPVTLSGAITVDGLSLKGDTVNRGTVELVGTFPGDRMALGFVEDGDYSLEVLPGTYSLEFAFGTVGNLVPQNRRVRLRKKLVLDKDKSLDIDIRTATVSGVVTFNGRPVLDAPDDYGMLYLIDRATGGEVALGPTFDGSFHTRVAHGTYDLWYEQAASLEWAPANSRAIVAKKIVVDGPTSVDVDIPSVRLEGNLSLTNLPEIAPALIGLPIPLGVSAVVLRSTSDGSTVRLGSTTPGRYEAILIPGRYEVLVEPLAFGVGAPVNPSARLWAINEIVVESDQAFDVEVTTVHVDGSITIDGLPWPDPSDYGDLYLHDVHEGRDVSLGPSFLGSYSVEILPGRYQVIYEARTTNGVAPVNPRTVVLDDLVITGEEVIDIDIPTVGISGSLEVESGDGEEPPDPIPDADVGGVALFDRRTAATTPLGQFSDGSYAARVIPGTYDLLFEAPDFSGIARNARHPLELEVDVTADLERDITIAPLVQEFFFTIDGMQPTSIVGNNYYLRTDDFGDQARVVTGESELLPGSYWLEYEGTGNSVVVKNRRARLECVTF